jgi:hypothetical protein
MRKRAGVCRILFTIAMMLAVAPSMLAQRGSAEGTKAVPSFGKLTIKPNSGSFSGTFSWSVGGGQAILKADTVTNTGASPATFRFVLYMTSANFTTPSNAFASAIMSLGTIGAGQSIAGNAAGTAVPWTSPGTGCWNMTLALEELAGGNYVVDDASQFSLRFDNFGGCITSFTTNPPSISPGGTSTLSWNTIAGSVSIDNGIGAVAATGTRAVNPASTTTFTLSLGGLANGVPPTATATVTINAPPPVPTATFSASPTSITQGQSSTLTWTTANATTVTIDGGVGAVAASGTRNVTPNSNATFTLTATGPGGTITRTATVTVTSLCSTPVVNNVTVSPNPVIAGETLTLNVSATGTNLSYEWYRGSSGDPASIFVGNGATVTTSETETGFYWVRVSTSCGAPPVNTPAYSAPLNTGSCNASTDLCLNGNRYKVSLTAKDAKGAAANGVALYQTNTMGFFSLPSLTGDAKNPEVFLKIVGPVAGVPWIFYSGLTNLDYTINITDTQTGKAMTPFHVAPPAAGALTSKGDFDVNGAHSSHCDPVTVTTTQGASGGICTPDNTTLCLSGSRFKVTLAAKDDPARTGASSFGVAIPRADGFGFFSVPGLTGDPKNLEVFVKIVNATALDGHFWVFLGGLTDLEYSLSITDTLSGRTRIYRKPLSSTCGWNDTSAF